MHACTVMTALDKCDGMDESQQAGPASWDRTQWNMDAIFFMLSDPLRRGMVLSIAKSGPQTAESLRGCSGRKMDATLKQLAFLCKSGMIAKKDNPADRRKPLYGFAPGFPVTNGESGVCIEFGFCTLRI